jgi:hypothetical protein
MSESEYRNYPDKEAKIKRRIAIEQMWLHGRSLREIAVEFQIVAHTAGQNLRAIRRRYGKRLAITIRRQRADSLAYYEAIYREAMTGWRRSQEPNTGSTTTKEDGKPVKEVDRVDNGPGTNAFLATAMRARKAIDAIYTDKPLQNHWSLARGPTVEHPRPPELSKLNDEEFANVVAIAKKIAYETFRKHEERSKRRSRKHDRSVSEVDAVQGNGDVDGLHAGDQAEIQGELAPRDPGGDAGSGGEGQLPPPDSLKVQTTAEQPAM